MNLTSSLVEHSKIAKCIFQRLISGSLTSWSFRQNGHFSIHFATKSVHFCEKSLFHVEPFKNCFQRILCSDSRSQLLFLFYENKHFLKKLVPYVASGQATRTKMTAIWFSSYDFLVKMATFQLTLRLKVSIFVKKHFFSFEAFKIVFKGLCVPTSEASCSSYFMKTDRQNLNFKLSLSPQIQGQKKSRPLQIEAQRLTM